MTTHSDVKTLVKILIGVAWMDGRIQPEERQYLHEIAKEKDVADDPEIQPLLYELRAVNPDECYAWVKEYLGDRPTSEACQDLIEAISALIYRDGTVAIEEAKLLSKLQSLDPVNEVPESAHNKVLSTVRKLYQLCISKLE
jgi:uncharacterized tellurite resistance protein B-like protein